MIQNQYKQLVIGKHLLTDVGFGQGGLRKSIQNFANVVQRSCTSEASPNWPGSGVHLRALEALVFKYVFSWFPEHLIIFQDISVLSNEEIFLQHQ